MSTIDRQRIAAVKTLEAMGTDFREDKWLVPDATGASPEADARAARPPRGSARRLYLHRWPPRMYSARSQHAGLRRSGARAPET